MPMPYTIVAEHKSETLQNNVIREVDVYGGEDSSITLKGTNEWDIIGVTPTQLSVLNTSSLLDTVINYSQVERLEITGTAIATNGNRIFWTTGGTIDQITVEGTRGGIPISVSTGGGADVIYLNGLIGDGSEVSAGEGDDYVRGSNYHDKLEGGAGTDTLLGGDGDDILIGGGGRDLMTGGAGSDVFKYTSAQDSNAAGIDEFGDFVKGVDKIDLSALGAKHWVSAFTERAGEVRPTLVGFQMDVNGDGKADLTVHAFAGWGGLAPSDFIWSEGPTIP